MSGPRHRFDFVLKTRPPRLIAGDKAELFHFAAFSRLKTRPSVVEFAINGNWARLSILRFHLSPLVHGTQTTKREKRSSWVELSAS